MDQRVPLEHYNYLLPPSPFSIAQLYHRLPGVPGGGSNNSKPLTPAMLTPPSAVTKVTRTTATVQPLNLSSSSSITVASGNTGTSSSSFAAALRKLAKQAGDPADDQPQQPGSKHSSPREKTPDHATSKRAVPVLPYSSTVSAVSTLSSPPVVAIAPTPSQTKSLYVDSRQSIDRMRSSHSSNSLVSVKQERDDRRDDDTASQQSRYTPVGGASSTHSLPMASPFDTVPRGFQPYHHPDELRSHPMASPFLMDPAYAAAYHSALMGVPHAYSAHPALRFEDPLTFERYRMAVASAAQSPYTPFSHPADILPPAVHPLMAASAGMAAAYPSELLPQHYSMMSAAAVAAHRSPSLLTPTSSERQRLAEEQQKQLSEQRSFSRERERHESERESRERESDRDYERSSREYNFDREQHRDTERYRESERHRERERERDRERSHDLQDSHHHHHHRSHSSSSSQHQSHSDNRPAVSQHYEAQSAISPKTRPQENSVSRYGSITYGTPRDPATCNDPYRTITFGQDPGHSEADMARRDDRTNAGRHTEHESRLFPHKIISSREESSLNRGWPASAAHQSDPLQNQRLAYDRMLVESRESYSSGTSRSISPRSRNTDSKQASSTLSSSGLYRPFEAGLPTHNSALDKHSKLTHDNHSASLQQHTVKTSHSDSSASVEHLTVDVARSKYINTSQYEHISPVDPLTTSAGYLPAGQSVAAGQYYSDKMTLDLRNEPSLSGMFINNKQTNNKEHYVHKAARSPSPRLQDSVNSDSPNSMLVQTDVPKPIRSKLDIDEQRLRELRCSRLQSLDGNDDAESDVSDREADLEDAEDQEDRRLHRLMMILSGPSLDEQFTRAKLQYFAALEMTSKARKKDMEYAKILRRRKRLRQDIPKLMLKDEPVNECHPLRVPEHLPPETLCEEPDFDQKADFLSNMGLDTLNIDKRREHEMIRQACQEERLRRLRASAENNGTFVADSEQSSPERVPVQTSRATSSYYRITEPLSHGQKRKHHLDDSSSDSPHIMKIIKMENIDDHMSSSPFLSQETMEGKMPGMSMASKSLFSSDTDKRVSREFAQEFHKSVLQSTRQKEMNKLGLLNKSKLDSSDSLLKLQSDDSMSCSIHRSHHGAPNTPPRWPGITAVIESYQRYMDELRVEKRILHNRCEQLDTDNVSLNKTAETLSLRMADLMEMKRQRDEERSVNQNSLDQLKSCLRMFR